MTIIRIRVLTVTTEKANTNAIENNLHNTISTDNLTTVKNMNFTSCEMMYADRMRIRSMTNHIIEPFKLDTKIYKGCL